MAGSQHNKIKVLGGIYRLGECIGEGAMGSVYRALDMAHDREVAIKLMKPDVTDSDRSHRIFQREARAMARLDHPGIIRIFGYGFEKETPYLVMECIDGVHLGRFKPPSRLDVVVGIIDAILEALGHAHARGVIHRDLKPANILLSGKSGAELPAAPMTPGFVKIGDFGIARIFESAVPDEPAKKGQEQGPTPRTFAELARQGFSAETRPHEVRAEGTPWYMAPELYKGKEGVICPANDIYAVGVLLYELLSGKRPFDVEYEIQLIVHQFKGNVPYCPVRPELMVREPPQDLIVQMLAPEPFERIQDCAYVRKALRLWYETQRPGAQASHLPWHVSSPWSRSQQPSAGIEEARTEAEINLLPWRSIPMLGRDLEQAQIWQTFGEVSEQSVPQAIVLQGDSGIGKTRLARWLIESVSEYGMATSLHMELGPESFTTALRSAIEGFFFTGSLDDALFVKRLRDGIRVLEKNAGHKPDPDDTALNQRLEPLVSFLRPGVSAFDDALDALLESYRIKLQRHPEDAALRRVYADKLRAAGRRAEALIQYLGLARTLANDQRFTELGLVCHTVLEIDSNNTQALSLMASVGLELSPGEDMPTRPSLDEGMGVEDSKANSLWLESNTTSITNIGLLSAAPSVGALSGQRTEGYALIVERVLRLMCCNKPVILFMDNVRAEHWEELLAFVWTLWRSGRVGPLPVLFMTTSTRVIPEHLSPSATNARTELQSSGHFIEMSLDPLDPLAVQTILDRYRSINRTLRSGILDAAGGNPLLAVELANQILSDAMAPPNPDDVEQSPLEDIDQLWKRRVRLVSRRSPLGTNIEKFLELAVCLEEPLQLSFMVLVWQAPELKLVHCLPRDHVVEFASQAWNTWVDSDILTEREPGVATFRHDVLRRALYRDICARSLASTYHSAAAWGCGQLGWPRSPREGFQLAGHYLGAELPNQAWRYAAVAAQGFLGHSQYAMALSAFELCERILRGVDVSPDDRRWDTVELGQARVSCLLGDVEQARRKAASLCRRGHRSGLARQLGAGELVLAELALQTNVLDEAEEYFDRALSRFETCSDTRGQAESLLGLAQVAMHNSRFDAARHCLQSMRNRLQSLKEPPDLLAHALLLLGQLEYRASRLVEARNSLEGARAVFERLGQRLGMAEALCELGFVCCSEGDPRTAFSIFQNVLDSVDQLTGSQLLIRAHTGLGRVHILMDYVDQAQAHLDYARSLLGPLVHPGVKVLVEALTIVVHVHADRWREAAGLLGPSLRHLAELEIFDPDLARCYEAVALSEQVRLRLNEETLRLLGRQTARQWRNLGDLDRAHRVLRELSLQ